MNMKFVRVCAALLAFAPLQVLAEDLATYVSNCKTALGLPQTTQFPAMNCLNGVLFALPDPTNGNGDPTNDWVVHTRVNESIDMVAACRWLNPTPPPPPNVQRAISLEMQIHNRDNGATCFFEARNDQAIPQGQNPNFTINPQIVPPTAANAGSYWVQPAAIDRAAAAARAAPAVTWRDRTSHRRASSTRSASSACSTTGTTRTTTTPISRRNTTW